MATEIIDKTGGRLRRTLSLWDLILYGVIVIQPVAPMSLFGVASRRGQGHVVTAILIAMVAMLLTAVSYGRMAAAYPSAGSAFTYVAQEIHPAVGYVTGWSMVMDYMLNPLLCTVWCAGQAYLFAPVIPPFAWRIFFAGVFTFLNLRGVKTSARINAGMAAGMGAVVIMVFIAAARYIFGHLHTDPIFYTRPFYDPRTFSWSGLFGCTSVAALTYIGFDGISTLSEEVENPRRNILLATVMTCSVIGVLSALEVYVAQLIWPASRPFPDVNAAYVFAAAKTWAPLFGIVGVTLVVANFGSGMGSHLGAARLLYGMGRSNAIPKSFFGAIEPKHRIPRNNVIFVGVIALVGSFFFSYELTANMLNFGAFTAFIGVNAAAFVRYYLRAEHKKVFNLLMPLFGMAICFLLWVNLSLPAKVAGIIWLSAGVVFGAWRTRGFRAELISFELPADIG